MGYLDVARFLVEHGANAEAQDLYGWTPLHLASQWGHLDVVRFLDELNARAAVQDRGE
jgi:serine/threonine-protein phosphatase 6 regulatory ankyrin repeat subunit B